MPLKRLNIVHSFFLAWIHFYLLLSTIYLTFECLSYFSDHFLKLKIYYGELNFEVIEEEEAYTVSICIITKNWICLVVLLQVSNSCCLTKYFGLNPSSVGGKIEPRHTKKKMWSGHRCCVSSLPNVQAQNFSDFSKRPEERTQHPWSHHPSVWEYCLLHFLSSLQLPLHRRDKKATSGTFQRAPP